MKVGKGKYNHIIIPPRTGMSVQMCIEDLNELGKDATSYVISPTPSFSVAYPMLSFPHLLIESDDRREEGRDSEDLRTQLVKVVIFNHSTKPVSLERGQLVAEGINDSSVTFCSMEGGVDDGKIEELMEWTRHSEMDADPPSEEKLRSRIEETLTHTTDVLKNKVFELLCQYKNVFAAHPSIPRQARLPPHTIEIEAGKKLYPKAPYRMSGKKAEEVRRQVKEKLEGDLLQPSRSPFSSPVVLALKPNGEYRFCVDYRELNKVTVPDRFPLPRIESILDSLAGNEYFSTLDAAAGFYQIPLAAKDREKTAFRTPDGLYEWKRMPMGLTNGRIWDFFEIVQMHLFSDQNHIFGTYS